MDKIILASTSPYRRELLSRLRIPFETEDPGVDESVFKSLGLPPAEVSRRLAMQKAQAVAARHKKAIVIGSDQVVAFDDEILGKPGTEEAAVAQLMALSGKIHELLTSIAVIQGYEKHMHTEVTRMRMERLDEEALRRYVAADLPLDCAGAYKIECLGVSLFRSIEGQDITAIQGLPMLALCRLLRLSGVTLP